MLHLVTRTGRRILSYWHLLTRRDRVTSEIDAEMRFHIDMETERLTKEHGLPLEEARRRALVSFGGVEKYKEAGHDVHGLRWLDALLLDSRFSLRMLLKHRGLTIVAGSRWRWPSPSAPPRSRRFRTSSTRRCRFPAATASSQLEFVGADPGHQSSR